MTDRFIDLFGHTQTSNYLTNKADFGLISKISLNSSKKTVGMSILRDLLYTVIMTF